VSAVIVLALGGTTDWVDGYAARRLGQVSRLGELLDPFADRLYILAALIGLTLRDVVPWWLTIALLLREAVLGIALLVLRRHGYGPPAVHYVGKTGTFVLLGAFPVMLLAKAVPSISDWVYPIGWGLSWWALGLYWAAAVLYLTQTTQLLRADRAATAGASGPSAGSSGPSAGSSGPSAGSSGPSAGSSGPSAGSSGPSAGSSGPSAGAPGAVAG
jgi:cardiolipin synthase